MSITKTTELIQALEDLFGKPRAPILHLGIGDVFEGGAVFSMVGQSQVFYTEPQLPFYPEWLLLSESLAELFTINDFKIGKESILLSPNPLPGFVAYGLGKRPVSFIGQRITIDVTFQKLPPGREEHAIRFVAAIRGSALQ